jgi:hypothetical protein
MTQLVFSQEELLREQDYAAPFVVAGQRIHGGLDAEGTYVSPRTALRPVAIENWVKALRERGGDVLAVDESLLDGVRYPNQAQQKLLLMEGLGQTFWNSLTITGVIEARGRLLAEATFPDFQNVVAEDISEMAIGHLNKGLLIAHGIDEGGEPDRGIGGHDVMWFVARDLAFGETDYPMPEVPASIGRPDGNRRLAPEIPAGYEQALTFLCNLLLIEFRAENMFRFSEQLLRDPEIFPERHARAVEAAGIVNKIRQDEEIHVTSLLAYLGELCSVSFKTVDGGTVAGREIVERIWDVIVRWSTVDAPKAQREQQRPILEARILAHPDGERILARFNELGD